METIMIIPGVTQIRPRPCVLALGFFDGVHRGHQRVIATAKAQAEKHHLPLVVMTFDRHASQVFNHQPFFYLTSPGEKAALMAALGVDRLVIVHFTRAFARLSPQAFVDDYLVKLGAVAVVAGFDYTFGRGGTTTLAEMPALARGRFTTTIVSKLTEDHQKISSTRIRKLIQAGRITEAEALLGHPYHPSHIQSA
ncbi:adenylyltransferase/cytidyltransferase family protein [Lacticaseibacillus sp. GG6-2]